MKISLLQENLQQVLQDIQKSIPSRPSLPILACILVQATSEKELTFSATDLNMGITRRVQAEVSEQGSMAVPAKVFIDYITSLSAGKLELTLEGHELTVQSSHSKAKIQCLSAADYPAFPEKEGDEVTFPLEFFIPAVTNTSFTASADEARPVLTSTLFSFGDALEVVSTDGFRLATLTLPYSTERRLQLLIPAKALQEVVRIATRKKAENLVFMVSEKLKQVFFSFDDVEVLVRLMDGDFPPYQKIIPADFSTQVAFDGSEFSQILKTAMIFARESAGIIRLKISGEELTLISSSATLGTQETRLPVQVIAGGNQEIAFNAKYLVDFLSVMKPEKIWFGMNESLKPALFRPEGMENYRYIVMPFRVNS